MVMYCSAPILIAPVNDMGLFIWYPIKYRGCLDRGFILARAYGAFCLRVLPGVLMLGFNKRFGTQHSLSISEGIGLVCGFIKRKEPDSSVAYCCVIHSVVMVCGLRCG